VADNRPIIVIKKKGGHAGHHGGAWKVAYADFVTAMMALFIVLWLLNSSKQVKEAVGGYFKDPTGTSKLVGNGTTGSGENFELTKDNMSQIKEELEKAVRQVSDFEKFKDKVEMTITSEGLRIEMMESEVGTFFPSGVSELNLKGKEILEKLAVELGKLPNKISMEGHTDSTPFAGRSNYGNWELSADRANAARRLMQDHGLRADQVTQVRGYADQRLKNAKDPHDSANRRISLIVQYQMKDVEEEEEAEAPAGGAAGGHGKPADGHSQKAPEKPASGHGAPPAEKGGHAAPPPAKKSGH
jgi:chemotaxis protein MotB